MPPPSLFALSFSFVRIRPSSVGQSIFGIEPETVWPLVGAVSETLGAALAGVGGGGVLVALLVSVRGQAAPNEIKVFTDVDEKCGRSTT